MIHSSKKYRKNSLKQLKMAHLASRVLILLSHLGTQVLRGQESTTHMPVSQSSWA